MSASVRTKTVPALWVLPVCLLLSWGLSRLPERSQSRGRALLLDAVQPIQTSRQWVQQQIPSWNSRTAYAHRSHIQDSQLMRVRLETELRQTRLQLVAALDERRDRQQASLSPFQLSAGDNLLQTEAIAAEVLSIQQQRFLHRHLLVETSDINSHHQDAMVLQAAFSEDVRGELEDSVVIDRGTTGGAVPSLPVFAGQCVVGMLADVGREVSRVRLLTDPEYRGRARIVRKLENGFASGPAGVLEGTGGKLCRLRYIQKTESVRVGDEVYTDDPSTSSSAPMYYGTIEKADLQPNEPEWTVWVRPGFDPENLATVQILKQIIKRDQ